MLKLRRRSADIFLLPEAFPDSRSSSDGSMLNIVLPLNLCVIVTLNTFVHAVAQALFPWLIAALVRELFSRLLHPFRRCRLLRRNALVGGGIHSNAVCQPIATLLDAHGTRAYLSFVGLKLCFCYDPIQ